MSDDEYSISKSLQFQVHYRVSLTMKKKGAQFKIWSGPWIDNHDTSSRSGNSSSWSIADETAPEASSCPAETIEALNLAVRANRSGGMQRGRTVNLNFTPAVWIPLQERRENVGETKRLGARRWSTQHAIAQNWKANLQSTLTSLYTMKTNPFKIHQSQT